MSFRPSVIRLAKEVQHRSPAIRFPDRKQAHHEDSHQVAPHPCAPQSVIDNFPRFQQAQANPAAAAAANSSSYGGPVDGSDAGGRDGSSAASSSGSTSSSSSGAVEEWQMPAWLKRNRYAPTEAEIEAVQSGGATEATEVTRATKLTWYTEQI
ncbi:hypothetical protein JCM10212_003673 [Sporobolomyces blumeae]